MLTIWTTLATLIPAQASSSADGFAIGHLGLRAAGNWPLYATNLLQIDWGAGLGVDYATGPYQHGQLAFASGDGGLVAAGELRYTAGFWVPRPRYRFGSFGGLEVGYATFEIGCGLLPQPHEDPASRTVAVCGLPEGQLINRLFSRAPKAGGFLGLGLRRGPLALAIDASLDAMPAAFMKAPDFTSVEPGESRAPVIRHEQAVYWDSDFTLRLLAFFD
jgi:hypothetical protein